MWTVYVKNEDGEWEISNEHAVESLAQKEASFLISKGLTVTMCWVD